MNRQFGNNRSVAPRVKREPLEITMGTIALVWKWLNDNAGALGIVLVVIPLA